MKAFTPILALLLGCSLSAVTFADPPEGRGWKKHRKHKEVAYEEYWDGNCKVTRKWKRNGDYEEKRKCKAPRDHHHRPAVVVLPPWFDRDTREPEYHPEWRPAPQPTATRCNSAKVGSVLGGLIGGVLGHQIGDGRGQTAATIGGAIAGVLVGGEIGRRMDQRNQACIGQALEFAPAGERIAWEDNQHRYAVTPGPIEQRGDRYCRDFTTEYASQDQTWSEQGSACRQQDGSWTQSF